MNIFKDLRIGLVCGFSGFTKISGDVISRNIIKEGGTFYNQISIKDHLEELNYLIVPAQSSLIKLLEILQLEKLPLCNIVIPDWAINSYKEKKLLSYLSYQWVDTEIKLPSKRESENTYVDQAQANINQKKMILYNENISEMNRKEKTNYITGENTKLREDLLYNKDDYTFSKEKNNLNEHITGVLEILINNYMLLKDKGRSFAYRSAITSLRSYPEKITCSEQVRNLSKVGLKIQKKIKEILETGTLKRVQAMDGLERLRSIKEFNKIWGIGTSTAERLFISGYRSILDLRAKISNILNENQKIG